MHRFALLAFFLLHFGVSAARNRHQQRSYGPATTTTVSITITVTETVSPTSTAMEMFPPRPYTVIAVRSGAPFHLLPINAAGFNFTLGDSPAIYCPNTPAECPNGNVTALYGSGAMVSVIYFILLRTLTSPIGC